MTTTMRMRVRVRVRVRMRGDDVINIILAARGDILFACANARAKVDAVMQVVRSGGVMWRLWRDLGRDFGGWMPGKKDRIV